MLRFPSLLNNYKLQVYRSHRALGAALDHIVDHASPSLDSPAPGRGGTGPRATRQRRRWTMGQAVAVIQARRLAAVSWHPRRPGACSSTPARTKSSSSIWLRPVNRTTSASGTVAGSGLGFGASLARAARHASTEARVTKRA